MYFKLAPLPPAHRGVFSGGINHPDLWLWDSWTLDDSDGHLHLYCLALAKTHSDGTAITPPQRNDYTFHVRRFTSDDAGHSWSDKGTVMQHGQMRDGADARNVWSGSVLRLDKETVAFGFTGIRDCGTDRRFLQTICIALGASPEAPTQWPDAALSCPFRDYDAIVSAGFYLGPRETLGSNQGEEGGPIMAWRDPFLFKEADGALYAVWSAKLSPTVPAVALARLKREGSTLRVAQLYPPVELPDAQSMTQAEVPKLYRDAASGDYLLMVSACDRRFEGQPDRELTHIHRLYRSAALTGPWRPVSAAGSALPGLEGLFGASLIDIDLAQGVLTVLGPYTENAGPERQLRFAPPVRTNLQSTYKTVRCA